MVTTFITHPTLTMSSEVILAGSKVIALGGLDTGSMNVNEQAIVGGRIKSKGFMHRLALISTMIGRKIFADATLAATCVRPEAPRVVMMIRTGTGRWSKVLNRSPI